MKNFSIFSGLILFFGFGVYVSVFKTKNIYDYVAKTPVPSAVVSRDPAAIKRTYDFSGLDGSALAFAAKQRLLEGARVVKSDSDLGMEFGHFVIKGSDGQKTFACQKYDKLLLSFIGEGSATNGELPKMDVQGTCEISNDINSIAALWIPVAKILGEPVSEGEFNFHEGRAVSIQFLNVADAWPMKWHLKSIKLFDSSGSTEPLEVSDQELRNHGNNGFTMDWKNN